MLEVIDKGSRSAEHPVPLLFVHGGWHGAWCWEHFLDFFADEGYRAVAVSLRGHGTSPTPKPLRKVSVADYIEDVGSVADDLGGAPILIGHSLGGFVIQRYLEQRHAPAAVLVGSVPPQGVLRMALRVWRRRPSMTMEAWNDPTLLKFLATPALAREYLFCAATRGRRRILQAASRGRKRPRRHDRSGAPARPNRRVTTPILVLGAEYDGFVSPAEVRATARAHRTEPEFFRMGHNMMLEPGWADVAERIREWLQAQETALPAR